MSGGVDSSLSAALLQEAGYEVIGVSLQLWCEQKHRLSPSRPTCCSLEDINDARRVCHLLGIPFYVLNLEQEFESLVVRPFCEEYSRGRTPNPCIACNQYIKFDLLLRKALSLGADFLATGHYARIEQSHHRYFLLKGVDASRDQSYFLYPLGQRELSHLLFPVGDYLKAEVRRMAVQRGLPVSSKKESRDLCFVPDRNYRVFLAQHSPPRPGDMVDSQGRRVGRHPGVIFYTVGQRCRAELSSTKRLYVLRICPDTNTLVVGSEAELYSDRLLAAQVNFVTGEKPTQPIPITAKIRYKSPEAPAMLYPRDGDKVEIRFEQPQRAITPGQAVVFYQGETVIGGGIIESSQPLSGLGEELVMTPGRAC
jgi:tRNA-specific 2-thiouridylase